MDPKEGSGERYRPPTATRKKIIHNTILSNIAEVRATFKLILDSLRRQKPHVNIAAHR